VRLSWRGTGELHSGFDLRTDGLKRDELGRNNDLLPSNGQPDPSTIGLCLRGQIAGYGRRQGVSADHGGRPDLKVIVCSGYSIDGLALEIVNARARGFLQKPFSVIALSEKVKAVLENNP